MIFQNSITVLKPALVLILGLMLFGCADSDDMASEEMEHEEMDASHTMAMEPNAELEAIKQAVRDFKAAQWDPERSEMAYELFAPDYVNLRSEFRNLEFNADDPALAAIADPMIVAIPDRQDVIEEILAEDNIVGVQTRITGTHEGNLYGIPATGKAIDIVSTAFYTFEDGKIVEAWEMADEAGLLRQIEQWLPERSDGLTIAPAINHPVDYGAQVLVDILAHPEDSDTYTNKVRVSSYKASIRPRNQEDPYLRPTDQVFDGRPYEVYKRRGFFHVADRSMELGTNDQGMGGAFPDRIDMVGKLIAEGDKVMISFLLSAHNTGSLFGIPPSNQPVGGWEVGVHTFEGTTWTEGWWFGDDLGVLMQIGAPGDFLIPNAM
jgi:steroid delta-isomerase-like uncharacterized protein